MNTLVTENDIKDILDASINISPEIIEKYLQLIRKRNLDEKMTPIIPLKTVFFKNLIEQKYEECKNELQEFCQTDLKGIIIGLVSLRLG